MFSEFINCAHADISDYSRYIIVNQLFQFLQGWKVAMKKTQRRSSTEIRKIIIQEATALFVEYGYAGTNMSTVNQKVGGSKGTIYKFFINKEGLFAAVLDEVLSKHLTMFDGINFEGFELKEGLENIACQTLATVSAPVAVDMWRLLYTEAPRNPEIAELFIKHGPEKTVSGVEKFINIHNKLGNLQCAKPHESAEYFMGMLLHKPMLSRYVEYEGPFSEERLDEIARQVSEDFLRICNYI